MYKYDLPALALKIASRVPFIGSKKLAKTSEQISKLGSTMQTIAFNYEHFYLNDWKFDDTQYLKLCDSLNKADSEEFYIDLRKVNLVEEGGPYLHGVRKFMLLEDVPLLNSGLKQVVQMN